MNELYHWFDLLGVAVFAISGTIVAYRKHMDGFGVVVLATVTAIGGGTVRDLILDVPVFWVHDNSYFLSIFFAAFITIIWLNQRQTISKTWLEVADAIGLAFFVVMGTQKALSLGVPDMTAIIMGTMTGCFGGMIRDVLARTTPMIFKGELYATTCILGAFVYTQLIGVIETVEIVMLIAMFTTLLMRFASIRWHLGLHVFKYKD